MSQTASALPPKKYSAKRSRIVAAATEVLNQQGTRGFTLVAVARLMAMHPVSLTYYFKTREDLFGECMLTTIKRFSEMVETARAVDGAPRERVAAFIAAFFAQKREYALGRAPAIASFAELKRLEPGAGAPVSAAFGSMLRSVQALFGDEADPVRRAVRSRLLIEHLGWTRGWIDLYPPDAYEGVGRRLADIVLSGIAAPGQAWPGEAPFLIGEGEDATQRGRFLIAASELINRHGYDGVSVDRIASSLNVTKGSFYHHNADKEELLLACFDRSFDLMREAQDRAPGASGWEKLARAVAALAAYQSAEPGGRLLRNYAIAALTQEARPAVIAKYRETAARFAALVAEGMADGSIRPVDPMIASQVVTGVVNASSYLGGWARSAADADVVHDLARPGLMGLLRP
jgi:AcrR family transcriptional regulator